MESNVIVEPGSGNIFTDLGYPDAQEALTKSRLAQRIALLLEAQKLKQADAAILLGIDQPKISKLICGQLKDFSIDRLFRFLSALNQDIEIIIKPRRRTKQYGSIKVTEQTKKTSRS